MVEKVSDYQNSDAGAAAYDEAVNEIYKEQMRASKQSGMNATNSSRMMKTSGRVPKPEPKATMTSTKPIKSLQAQPPIASMPAKPKVSLMNNRNKADHVRTLMCGVEKPKAEGAAKPSSSQSLYRQQYAWQEEAKEMVAQCD